MTTDLSYKIPLDHLSFHFHTIIKDDQIVHSFFKSSISKGVHLVIKAENSKASSLEYIVHFLLCYFYQKPLPIHPPLKIEGSLFMKDVYQALIQVPLGKTTSYQELARASSHEKASRAVGSACHNNALPLWIPCHRVIHADTSLGGFAFGSQIKKQLLIHEGVYQSSMDLFELYSENVLFVYNNKRDLKGAMLP